MTPVTRKQFTDINWDPLTFFLVRKYKHPLLLKPTFETLKEQSLLGQIRVGSTELKYFAGLLSKLYTTLKLTDAGGAVVEDGVYYFLPLHFRWDYVSGGSNGTEAIHVWFHYKSKIWFTKDRKTGKMIPLTK